MDRVLLDTDIFSEILRGRNARVTAKAAEYRAIYGRHPISIITVIEIVKGLHKIRREDRIQQFLKLLPALELLPLDLRSAELAGRIHADLELAGQPIGRADPIIAAIALGNDRMLVTGNASHYRRVQALGYPLGLIDWRA